MDGNEFIDQLTIKQDFFSAESSKPCLKCENHFLKALSNCNSKREDVCSLISEIGVIAIRKGLTTPGMKNDLNEFFKKYHHLDFIKNSEDEDIIKGKIPKNPDYVKKLSKNLKACYEKNSENCSQLKKKINFMNSYGFFQQYPSKLESINLKAIAEKIDIINSLTQENSEFIDCKLISNKKSLIQCANNKIYSCNEDVSLPSNKQTEIMNSTEQKTPSRFHRTPGFDTSNSSE